MQFTLTVASAECHTAETLARRLAPTQLCAIVCLARCLTAIARDDMGFLKSKQVSKYWP